MHDEGGVWDVECFYETEPTPVGVKGRTAGGGLGVITTEGLEATDRMGREVVHGGRYALRRGDAAERQASGGVVGLGMGMGRVLGC
jgi:hypothetical protein